MRWVGRFIDVLTTTAVLAIAIPWLIGSFLIFSMLRGLVAGTEMLSDAPSTFMGALGFARRSSRQERAALQRGEGLLIGRDAGNDRLLRYDGPAHLLNRLDTHSHRLRLLVAQALQDMARYAERPQERLRGAEGPADVPDGDEGLQRPGEAPRAPLRPATGPVRSFRDKFAALGRLEPVARALGLMAQGEILQLAAHLQLLRLQRQPVTLARKLRYYADPEFKTLFDPDTA